MPWLSAEYSFGDTSPLTRFVMGLDEALRDYRGSEESPLPRDLGSSRDPWNEDLFYRRLPVQSRGSGPENDNPRKAGHPNAMQPGPRRVDQAGHSRFGDNPLDESGVRPSSPASWLVAGLKVVVGLFATMGLMPAIPRYVPREVRPVGVAIPTKARRDDQERADPSA
jgi:hypothetical protein